MKYIVHDKNEGRYSDSFPFKNLSPSPKPFFSHSFVRIVLAAVSADIEDRASVRVFFALENNLSTETDAAGMAKMSRAISEMTGKCMPYN